MSNWTEERVERLKTLWAEGLSCSQIARALGGVTRCGVMGKVFRLGLPPRATAHREPRQNYPQERKAPRPTINKAPPEPVVEEAPVILADGSHVTILTVTDRMCRWPIGDPSASNFHFCGRSPKLGAPYCDAHCRKAYTPIATAESRKKGAEVDAALAAQADRTMRRMFG